MSFLDRFSKAFAWNHLNKITGYFFDFILSIILARGFGNYYYGVYSELFNFIFLFSLLCSFGIDTAINVYIPKAADNPGQVAKLLKSTLITIAVTSSVLVVMLMLYSGPMSRLINSPELNILLKISALFIVFHNFLIIAQTILICFYNTKFLFIANSILKLSFIIAAYLMFIKGTNIQQIIIAFTIISTFVSIAYMLKFFKYLKPRSRQTNVSDFLKFGLIAWFTKFINYLLGRYFDIFLLGYFSISKAAIGYYNIAFSITMALFYVFTSGFSGISLAAFSELAKKNNRKSISLGWQAVTKICIFFGVPVFEYAIFNARHLIVSIYSASYLGSVILFQVFASFYLVNIILGGGINVTILYAMKRGKLVLIIRCLVGLLNVILDVILIPHYQTMGAIIATGISIVIYVGCEYIFARRFVVLKYPFLFLLKIMIASVLALGCSYFVPITNIFSLLLNGLFFCIVFIATMFILKPLSAMDKKAIGEINSGIANLLKYF